MKSLKRTGSVKIKVVSAKPAQKIYVVEYADTSMQPNITFYREHHYTFIRAKESAKEKKAIGFKRVVINEFELGFIKQHKV